MKSEIAENIQENMLNKNSIKCFDKDVGVLEQKLEKKDAKNENKQLEKGEQLQNSNANKKMHSLEQLLELSHLKQNQENKEQIKEINKNEQNMKQQYNNNIRQQNPQINKEVNLEYQVFNEDQSSIRQQEDDEKQTKIKSFIQRRSVIYKDKQMKMNKKTFKIRRKPIDNNFLSLNPSLRTVLRPSLSSIEHNLNNSILLNKSLQPDHILLQALIPPCLNLYTQSHLPIQQPQPIHTRLTNVHPTPALHRVSMLHNAYSINYVPEAKRDLALLQPILQRSKCCRTDFAIRAITVQHLNNFHGAVRMKMYNKQQLHGEYRSEVGSGLFWKMRDCVFTKVKSYYILHVELMTSNEVVGVGKVSVKDINIKNIVGTHRLLLFSKEYQQNIIAQMLFNWQVEEEKQRKEEGRVTGVVKQRNKQNQVLLRRYMEEDRSNSLSLNRKMCCGMRNIYRGGKNIKIGTEQRFKSLNRW